MKQKYLKRWEEFDYDKRKHGPLPRGRKRMPCGTRWEVANDKPPVAPLGDLIWKVTKQVVLNGPLQYAQGRVAKTWVYCRRGKKLFTRPWVKPPNPRTGFQTDQRQRFLAAQREWSIVSQANRDAWCEAAEKLRPGQLHS